MKTEEKEKLREVYPPKRKRYVVKEAARLRIPEKMKDGLKEEGEKLAVDLLVRVLEHRKKEGDGKEWIEISRNMKVKLLGKKYSRHIRALQERGILKAYKVEGKAEYYRKGGWRKNGNGEYEKKIEGEYGQCKMYRLNKKLTREVKKGKVETVELMLSVALMKKRIALLKDMTDMNDAAAAKLKQNVEKLDRIELTGLSYKGMVNAEKTNQRIVDANRRNESGRLFSVLLQGGSKEVKERLYYKDEKLNEIDMKSAHVQLIAALLPEPYRQNTSNGCES